MPAPRKRRKVLFALAALGFAVLIALCLAEILLRLAWTPPSFRSDQPFGAHPVYGMAPLPGISGQIAKWEYDHAFTHNDQGLRAASNYQAGLPEGDRKRVLFLGDSFTYGLGSEDDEIFVARVDEALPGVEVVNSGSNGYGQREQLAVLDTLGAALQPDLTVLMFFWNDLEDNTQRTEPAFALDEGGRLRRTDRRARHLEGFDPLELRQPAESGKERESGLYIERILSEGLRGLRYKLIGIRRRSISNEAESEAAWETTRELLELVRARADEIGTRLLLVSIPDHNTVDPDAVIKGIDPLHFAIEPRLAEVCGALGIDYLDLSEPMREAHGRSAEPLYYYADRHLTPAGNAALAGALAPEIEARLGE